MRAINFLILLVFLIFLYIFSINMIASGVLDGLIGSTTYTRIIGGSTTKLSVSDTVSVLVERDRFFGTTKAYHNSEGVSSTFYFFNILPIPMEEDDTKYLKYHIVFLIFLVILSIVIPAERGVNLS